MYAALRSRTRRLAPGVVVGAIRALSTRAAGPLAGYRVLELQGLAAAPLAGQILADFGADVVRVDAAGREAVHLGASVLGRGKRSVALDLKSESGRSKCKSLAENCDVILEGFRPGVMERLGLGPDDLFERNPGLVFARITGWGQDGAWSSMVCSHFLARTKSPSSSVPSLASPFSLPLPLRLPLPRTLTSLPTYLLLYPTRAHRRGTTSTTAQSPARWTFAETARRRRG